METLPNSLNAYNKKGIYNKIDKTRKRGEPHHEIKK